MTEEYVTLAEVRDLLTLENENRELLTTQKAAMEHARKISAISVEDAKKLMSEINEIEEVNAYTAVKIVDLLPKYPEDVRAIFSKERVNLEPSTIDKIIDTVSRYL